MNYVYYGDNLPILREMPSGSVDLVYTDPPFNTGRKQSRVRLTTIRNPNGDRIGFKGQRYETIRGATFSFADYFDDYLAFLEPRLIEIYRVLKPHGCLYFHIDYREVHYCKILLDSIFGRDCFLNEIIWAYDYGARTTKKWPPKHDNILFYVKDPVNYVFNADAVERIPYMAPGLVTPEKVARGKFPTDTWWHTIVPPGGRESTGYATQKPIGVVKRIVAASSNPGDVVMDPFAGSGTLGEVAYRMRREFVLIDNNEQALVVMAKRFALFEDVQFIGFDAGTLLHAPKQPLLMRDTVYSPQYVYEEND